MKEREREKEIECACVCVWVCVWAACWELDESSAMCINHKNYILVNCKMPTSIRGRQTERGRERERHRENGRGSE